MGKLLNETQTSPYSYHRLYKTATQHKERQKEANHGKYLKIVLHSKNTLQIKH